MSKVLLFIFGSICFQAQGGFPERFLNLCHVKGVKLYHLTEKNGALFAATSLSSFRKIRLCASRSGMRVRITEKRGLPFIYARFAKRTGLFVGIALAGFLLFFYARSVWLIEVSGNERISVQQVKAVLAKNGVREGTLKKDIDYDRISFELYDALGDIAWLNVGIDGSRLCVDLRERVQRPANEDNKEYANVVAAKAGVIDTLRVYEGEGVVLEGDGVIEGQLLVSGVVYHEQSKKNTFHCSRAEIFAYTKETVHFTIPKVYRKTAFTGRSRQYAVLQLFRLKLPLYLFSAQYREQEVSELKQPLFVRGKELPIALYHYELREQKSERCKADRKTAAVFARTKRKAYESKLKKGTKILSCKEKVTEKADCFVFEYHYNFYENIAKTAPIAIENKQKTP